jgi:acyl-CoA thioester hydrolase
MRPMSQPFRYYLRVRFAECDAQRVVFNACYGNYIDMAVIEFLRAAGLGTTFLNGPLDYQLVKQTTEWKLPARFDDVLEISIIPKHLGNTSFTLAAEFRVAGQEAILVSAETVYVLVDAKTVTKTAIPADVRATIERGAQGLYTDHADCTAHEGDRRK